MSLLIVGTENSVRARKCAFNLPESLQASGHWPAESLPCKDWPDLPLSLMSDRIWAVDHGAARPTALTRTHDKTPVRSRQDSELSRTGAIYATTRSYR